MAPFSIDHSDPCDIHNRMQQMYDCMKRHGMRVKSMSAPTGGEWDKSQLEAALKEGQIVAVPLGSYSWTAQDDNEPITAEWLSQPEWTPNGPLEWCTEIGNDLIRVSLRADGTFRVSIENDEGEVDGGGVVVLRSIKTRGQLRKLVAALKGE